LWNLIIKSNNNNSRSSSSFLKRYISLSIKETEEKGVIFSTKKITKNYLALANFYQIIFNEKSEPITTNSIFLGKGNENNTIGLRFLSDNENIIGGLNIIPEKRYSSYLKQTNSDNYLIKDIFKKPITIYNYFFTLSIISTPILSIYFIYKKHYNLLLISGSSFLFFLMFAIMSMAIDRYAIPSILLSNIGIIYLFKQKNINY